MGDTVKVITKTKDSRIVYEVSLSKVSQINNSRNN
jgi:hypothetical protein